MTVTIVPKKWGREEIFADTEHYAGKLLVFDKGAEASKHYHRFKHESWLVLSGGFEIEVDGVTKVYKPGDTLTLLPRSVHWVKCIEAGAIVEASTRHSDADVVRISESKAGTGEAT